MWKRVWARAWEWEVPAWTVIAFQVAVLVVVWAVMVVAKWARGDFVRLEP